MLLRVIPGKIKLQMIANNKKMKKSFLTSRGKGVFFTDLIRNTVSFNSVILKMLFANAG